MVLRAWSDHRYRSTRDLDLLHRGDGSAESIRRDIEAICATAVEPDGLRFDSESIHLEPIRPEGEYDGTRITMYDYCGSERMDPAGR